VTLGLGVQLHSENSIVILATRWHCTESSQRQRQMRIDIHAELCQRAGAFRQQSYGELHPFQIAEAVTSYSRLITDLPVTESGKDAIIVLVDRLSKMVHVDEISQKTTNPEPAFQRATNEAQARPGSLGTSSN
jgi:hypothetical protein